MRIQKNNKLKKKKKFGQQWVTQHSTNFFSQYSSNYSKFDINIFF
jgi:hypothetical protein